MWASSPTPMFPMKPQDDLRRIIGNRRTRRATACRGRVQAFAKSEIASCGRAMPAPTRDLYVFCKYDIRSTESACCGCCNLCYLVPARWSAQVVLLFMAFPSGEVVCTGSAAIYNISFRWGSLGTPELLFMTFRSGEAVCTGSAAIYDISFRRGWSARGRAAPAPLRASGDAGRSSARRTGGNPPVF